MKRDYMRPSLARMDVEAASIILDGSYTNKAIKVSSVTVEDYTNGFLEPDGNGGFSGPDFKDITFD